MFLQNTETWLTFVPNVACLPHSICFLADCHIRRRREDGVVITSPTLPIERPQFKPVRTSKAVFVAIKVAIGHRKMDHLQPLLC